MKAIPVMVVGVLIAVGSITAFFIGAFTRAPSTAQDSGYQEEPWPNKGERQPPRKPREPAKPEKPCIPVRIIPSQEMDGQVGQSQGTQLPVCPDAVGMALNIQTQVGLHLGELQQKR